ncbi:FAD-dependent 5-carboxymethylaminomethyl-2-thiouridine(34) oxidoreductase MnmC [Amphibiibacter pelophylacis]|uniref:FAD-dependent 5-carboxymethylaminomethyl-2-thiouridine(34) oxidoreductase MnmC n=1 Tax=Amphibiibacter pelophylacis TaxID=1799477 RepID=A0ACC6P3D9_9BURK
MSASTGPDDQAPSGAFFVSGHEGSNAGGVRPARVVFDAEGTAHAPGFGDVYHSRAGAAAQARAVFLAGNGLPERWQDAAQWGDPARPFTLLETGFGLGHNLLSTLQAWRDTPRTPGARLLYLAVEQFPARPQDLAQAHGLDRQNHQVDQKGDLDPADIQRQALARELLAQWPPCTPGSHTLRFDGGRVTVRLWLGDAARVLPRLQAQVDAVYLDGFSPQLNPALWSPELMRQVARLSRPGATLATWSTAPAVRDALTAAGFVCQRRPGFGGKRRRLEAHYQPRWHAPRPAAFQPVALPRDGEAHAVIVGGGLAGASTAQALALRGWRCTVLDAAAQPASGASGNPAGLLHGIVHLEDGSHARWLRSAALFAHGQIAPLLAQETAPGRVPGRLNGFLRLQDDDAHALQQQMAALGMDERYARVLDAAETSALLGLPLQQSPKGSALLFAHGGWVSPAALVRHWLDTPGVHWRGGADVARLQRETAGATSDTPPRWLALDADGMALADPADAIVVASAHTALPLLQRSLAPDGGALWWAPELRAQRGQISQIRRADLAAAGLGSALPRLPLSRYAYALDTQPGHPGGGELVFGATHQWDDGDERVRDSDHRDNLQRLAALLGEDTAQSAWQALPWHGRTGWRCISPDRLPLLGRVPSPAPSDARTARRPYASQHIAREDGLYLCTALGSRGLTLAPLLGETLAALITGEALPVDTRLMAALDPARWALATLARK